MACSTELYLGTMNSALYSVLAFASFGCNVKPQSYSAEDAGRGLTPIVDAAAPMEAKAPKPPPEVYEELSTLCNRSSPSQCVAIADNDAPCPGDIGIYAKLMLPRAWTISVLPESVSFINAAQEAVTCFVSMPEASADRCAPITIDETSCQPGGLPISREGRALGVDASLDGKGRLVLTRLGKSILCSYGETVVSIDSKLSQDEMTYVTLEGTVGSLANSGCVRLPGSIRSVRYEYRSNFPAVYTDTEVWVSRR
jgi:hypothetical protein